MYIVCREVSFKNGQLYREGNGTWTGRMSCSVGEQDAWSRKKRGRRSKQRVENHWSVRQHLTPRYCLMATAESVPSLVARTVGYAIAKQGLKGGWWERREERQAWSSGGGTHRESHTATTRAWAQTKYVKTAQERTDHSCTETSTSGEDPV